MDVEATVALLPPTLTLIAAATRSGEAALARHYIEARTVHNPASGWGWRLPGRAW